LVFELGVLGVQGSACEVEGANKWETVIRNAAVGHLPNQSDEGVSLFLESFQNHASRIANTTRIAPPTQRAVISQSIPRGYTVRMNATNKVSSPITPSKRTTLFFWLVKRASQTPFPFNHLPRFDSGKSPAGLTEPWSRIMSIQKLPKREKTQCATIRAIATVVTTITQKTMILRFISLPLGFAWDNHVQSLDREKMSS